MLVAMTDVADAAASLSLIFVLALAYGALHRRMPDRVRPQCVLGVLFGVVALLEMMRPIEPFDGVLIDLRNVPIALAGAFLGRSGLACCLIIAIISRWYLGGVGATAGIAGMCVAGGMGYIWQKCIPAQNGRHIGHMVLLAALMSAHIATGLMLPGYAMLWFFGNAVGPLLMLNLLAVPIAALILDRERTLIQQTADLQSAAEQHTKAGLMAWPRFSKEVASHMTASPNGTVAGLAEITVDHRNWLGRILGLRDEETVLGAMRFRLENSEFDMGYAGLLLGRRIMVPISADLAVQPARTAQRLHHLLSPDDMTLPGGLTSTLDVNVVVHQAASHPAMADLLHRLSVEKTRSTTPPTAPRTATQKPRVTSDPIEKPQLDLLFDKASLMMSARRV